jgi:EAL domain-containing protein (putative c-di-GMP-specific phosphodiesterase class I)
MAIDFSNLKDQDILRLYTSNLKNKKLLYDQNTNLPTVAAVQDILKQKLETTMVIGVIYIKVESISLLETKFGWETYDDLIQTIDKLILEALETTDAGSVELTISYARGDEFNLFVFSQKNGGKVTPEYLEYLSEFLEGSVNRNLRFFSEKVNQSLSVLVGYSLIINNNFVRAERLIYKGVRDAQEMANIQEERSSSKRKESLKGIISKRNIRTLFQPIVAMENFEILGFEALSSGPPSTDLESPEILFALADKVGLTIDLDRICREEIVKNSQGLPKGLKLFINIEPLSLDDPQFRKEIFVKMLEDLEISPTNVVLEITERVAIKDFDLFVQSLEQFKSAGFKIAVDDAGAGYASLNSIAHLKPEFLKFDMALVRNIDRDHIKQQLLETLLNFAHRIDSNVIAEGIETKAEFDTLRSLNVKYGQGYFLARPAPPFPGLREEIFQIVKVSKEES